MVFSVLTVCIALIYCTLCNIYFSVAYLPCLILFRALLSTPPGYIEQQRIIKKEGQVIADQQVGQKNDLLCLMLTFITFTIASGVGVFFSARLTMLDSISMVVGFVAAGISLVFMALVASFGFAFMFWFVIARLKCWIFDRREDVAIWKMERMGFLFVTRFGQWKLSEHISRYIVREMYSYL
mmetsp:Transcript_12645/g.13887  ORF Transcript_12645/g.13887 Transcript_12645/m.13887 type:complete len:182 (-) Transcript_12645:155-700(-)